MLPPFAIFLPRVPSVNQAVPATSTSLVSELDLGSARGGKAGSREPLVVVAVRGLTPDDLPAISNPPPIGSSAPTIQTIRHSHHQLAQLIAEGKEGAEISRVTGYSLSRISILQTDPAFNELIAYYSAQRELVFVDAQERLRILGLDATEMLHSKLHDQTVEWSNRELMEVVELALVSPMVAKAKAAQGAFGPPSGALNLNVKFVGARAEGPGPVIEATFTETSPRSQE